ncbi:MAG: DUF333 domain-containing protein [Pseudomonadota bacterium]
MPSRISLVPVGFFGVAAAVLSWQPVNAGVGLANPAAEHCISEGGLFGLVDEDAGKRGVCLLPDGEQVDAWDLYRDAADSSADSAGVQIANPAAAACAGIGGAYQLNSSICRLPDGAEIDAWALLRRAHAASLANPAATACLDAGGAYEIRDSDTGKTGICRLPDGRAIDAWAFFRQTE